MQVAGGQKREEMQREERGWSINEHIERQNHLRGTQPSRKEFIEELNTDAKEQKAKVQANKNSGNSQASKFKLASTKFEHKGDEGYGRIKGVNAARKLQGGKRGVQDAVARLLACRRKPPAPSQPEWNHVALPSG